MIDRKSSVAAPLLIITVGTGWLLTTHNVIPGVNWIWVLGLAVVGVLILVVGGLDKVTAVVGPFLIIATVFSLLRQTERIGIDTEVPSLVIVAGVLMLAARFLPLPAPKWLLEDEDGRRGDEH
jgi:hypothetical protein